jgi:hypothetical protein
MIAQFPQTDGDTHSQTYRQHSTLVTDARDLSTTIETFALFDRAWSNLSNHILSSRLDNYWYFHSVIRCSGTCGFLV